MPKFRPVIFFFLAFTPAVFGKISLPVHLSQDERNTIEVYREASNKVVNISNLKYARVSYFSDNLAEVPTGNGSGFIWGQMGHIVTNFHVVQGADKLIVSYAGGKTEQATIVGVEPKKDIAVLKVPKHPIVGFPLANSSELIVGQKTLAIGSPFGLDQTLTTGIVSALERSIPGIGNVTIRGMIQTDASINPGNSGGPLLDSRGFLIGMNTIIMSRSGSSSGVGFAVPVNVIKRIVTQIIRYGKVRQPGLGISIFPDEVIRQLNMNGILIRDVVKNSGADKAGIIGTRRDRLGDILLGDIIVAIDGEKVKNYDDLYNLLENKQVGTYVQVDLIRNNSRKSLKVQLTEVND